ncbi:expressed unknown protein [Seminavis robusta]|uniref:Uncharacterized protein n=1 Tax=Seminavis robusta TaxID=568900 RepID=A0A9N8H1P3_9STRA|nr:expressed unknown protein [Seminavis robusta]|eukprot:Sro20_g014340.1 n/a (545) ;mRNA; r:144568-146202
MVANTAGARVTRVAEQARKAPTSVDCDDIPLSPQVEGRSPVAATHDSRTPTRFEVTPTGSISPEEEESATPKRRNSNLGSNSSLPNDILESLSLSLSDVRPTDNNPRRKDLPMRAPEPPETSDNNVISPGNNKTANSAANDPVPNNAPAPKPVKKPRRLSAATLRRQAQLQVQRKGLPVDQLLALQGVNAMVDDPNVELPKREVSKEPPRMQQVSQPIIGKPTARKEEVPPLQPMAPSTPPEVEQQQMQQTAKKSKQQPVKQTTREEEGSPVQKKATLGSRKVVSSPERNSVKFLADPDTSIVKSQAKPPSPPSLEMPTLDDNDAKPRASSIQYKKSSSFAPDEVDKTNDKPHVPPPVRKKAPPVPSRKGGLKTKSSSVPSLPVTKREAMVDEKKLMANAQQSLESLSAGTLAQLMKALQADKTKTSTNMKRLVESNPAGSFVVESKPGTYHVLTPNVLARFVAQDNAKAQRRHSVSNASITKATRQAARPKAPPTKPTSVITTRNHVEVDVDSSEIDVDDLDLESEASSITQVTKRESFTIDV